MERYKCAYCEKIFADYKYKKSKYCSKLCYFNDHRRTAKCPICGKEKVIQKNKPQKDFCSLRCWGLAHRNQVTLKCAKCGKIFSRPFSQGKRHNNQKNVFCSKLCADSFRKLPREEFWRRWKARVKQYRKDNPDKTAMWKQNRRSREMNAKGSFTEEEWKNLKIKFNNKCAICGLERKLTIDHIIPLAKNGTNYIDNIQPLCMPCNSKKSTKI